MVRQSGLGGFPKEELPKGFPGLRRVAFDAAVKPTYNSSDIFDVHNFSDYIKFV